MSKKDKPKTMNDIREMYGLPRIENEIKYNDYLERLQEKDKEIERLHSIIKEVREYIEKYVEDEYDYNGLRYISDEKRHVLEILGRENNDK